MGGQLGWVAHSNLAKLEIKKHSPSEIRERMKFGTEQVFEKVFNLLK